MSQTPINPVAGIIDLSPETIAKQIGMTFKYGNIVTPTMITNGTPVQDYDGNYQVFKMIKVGTSGNVVVLGVNGRPYPIRALLAGQFAPANGVAILPSATFNGLLVETTATIIDWFGGE